MKNSVLLTFFLALILLTFNVSAYAEDVPDSEESADITVVDEKDITAVDEKSPLKEATDEDEEIDYVDIIEMETTFIKDPIQPFNRAVFVFNDKVYYHFFRPLSNGYKAVLPEKARLGVRHFFTNIRTPVRFFNCVFQGKFKGAGTELLRLTINSTMGVGGFSDPAKKYFKLDIQEEDFGQTLGRYNVGAGSFIELPLLGPSNVRDTIGLLGDIALDPITLLSFFVSPYASTGVRSYNTLNDVSIDKGETYESLVEQAIDPYIAVQDAYTQNRIKKINE